MRKRLFPTLLLTLLIGISLLSQSCARKVTDTSVNLEVEFDITFRGPIDLSKYNYYVLLSSSTSPLTPSQPPPDEYFPSPGRLFNAASPYITAHSNGITYFYQTYFSTWSDYLIYNKDGLSFYPSNATHFDPTTDLANSVGNYPPNTNFKTTYFAVDTATNTLKIRFSTQYLSNSTATNLHFTFVTSRYGTDDGDNGTGTILDVLDSQTPYEPLVVQDTAGTPDTSGDVPNDAGADITSWRFKVF